MFGLGIPELIAVVVLVLLFFGKDKLPDLARGVGNAVRELRNGIQGEGTLNDGAKPSKKS